MIGIPAATVTLVAAPIFLRWARAKQVHNQTLRTLRNELQTWIHDASVTGDKQEAAQRILQSFETKDPNLYLDHLGLSSLPSCIGKLIHLELLELTDNDLNAVPNSIGELTNLRILNLIRNQIARLPDEIGNLSQLNILLLSGNEGIQLSEALRSCAHLRNLSLSNTSLQEVPEFIRDFRQLHTLDLSNNELTRLPDWIGELSNIDHLNLARNLLTELPDSIQHLSRLYILTLNGNELTELPEGFDRLLRLHTLNFEYNNFSELPNCIRQFTNLKNLNFSNNELRSIPSWIGELSLLEHVYLQGNLLREIPDVFDQLTHLRSLNISQNDIRNIPPSVQSLENRMRLEQNLLAHSVLQRWDLLFKEAYPEADYPHFYPFPSSEELAQALPGAIQDELSPYLLNLESTEDFIRNSVAKKDLILQVHQMMVTANENREFQELLLGLLSDANARCGDRTTQVSAHIDIQRRLLIEDLDLMQYSELLIGYERLNRVDALAQKIAEERGLGDVVEVQLAVRINLKEDLKLPITTQNMLFPGMCPLTAEEINQVKEQILKETDDRLSILLESPLWGRKIRKVYPEKFAEILKDMHDELERLENQSFAREQEKIDVMEQIPKRREEKEAVLIRELTQSSLVLPSEV